jgi:D-alanine-D-alanine ligase
MVEEFIDGREFTVLVAENPDCLAEPIVYTPVECNFPEGETFKHFDLKWVNYEGIQWVPVEDDDIASKLKDMARKVFVGLGGTGYGRIDARGDREGNVYFLEINPNCGIFYPPEAMGSADFILTLDTETDHKKFVNHIIR